MMRRSLMVRKAPMARGASTLQRSSFMSAPKVKGPGLAQSVAMMLGTAIDHVRKPSPVFRSVEHRMNVAALPCVCCGLQKNSQAAHLNLLALGKGKGLKVSDALTIPLCRTRPGIIGCHVGLDSSGQYDKATSATLQLTWLHETRDTLIRLDKWKPAAEADMVRIVGAYLARAA